MRFELQMDVLAADTEARTIEGLVAPYGEVGTIKGGSQVRFKPGSLTLARARTPLLVDHDHSNPIGVLAELTEGDSGPLGRFKVDATPAGDMALVQAASGSRGALSIGAASDRGDYEEVGGVIEISAARIHEVSLVALAAFDSAAVTRVAAEAPEPDEEEPGAEPEEEQEPDPNQTELPVAPEEGAVMSEASAAAPVIIAARHDEPARDPSAGELVGLIIRAQHGEPDARRYLEAALAETISTDVSGLLPPQYERTVIGSKETPRPLYTIFRSRALPGVGLALNKPKWTTRPDGQWAANVDADATSTKVVVGSQAASVQRWDWAGAISWVVVQRSDPSIIDEIYAEAVQDFYLDVETKIAALLAAAATDTATAFGEAVAKFFVANGRSPEVAIVAPDVWGKLADKGALTAPIAGVSVGTQPLGLSATWGGIPIVASGSIAATFGYLATRRALDARVTEPVRLTANAIGALNVELAVVGEGLFDTDYPAEVMEFAPTITP